VTILAVEALALHRGNRKLAANLSFSLLAGEVLHLRGANGIGKTSLLETLSGLRRVEQGRLVPAPEPTQLHWLGHKNALNLALTPQENLEFWCGLNQISFKTIAPALETLGVNRVRHRPCRTLSAGQKRRSALARLLLSPRKLWLLDEPLDGLDAQGLSLFAELLNEHVKPGGAAVITSHQALPPTVLNMRELVLQ
jgi:heme exporter protein A